MSMSTSKRNWPQELCADLRISDLLKALIWNYQIKAFVIVDLDVC